MKGKWNIVFQEYGNVNQQEEKPGKAKNAVDYGAGKSNGA
jgi:hypothetical protein